MNIIKVAVGGSGVALAIACHSTGFVAPTTTGALIDTTPNERALKELVSERCTREVNCGDIGKGHLDSSYDACVSRTRPTTRDALLSNGCDKAIDRARLNRCIDAIRSDSCGKPGEAITNIDSCTTVDLCQ